MKAVVIYKSKTGFAKKYAEWIAEDLKADIFEVSKVTMDRLSIYDVIIFGGSLYAVGINGVKVITQNINMLKDKKLIVFATGASPSKEDTINEIINKNFTLEQQKYIKFFYLRGGFNYGKLSIFDKMLMTLLKWKIESKKKKGNKLTFDEIGMLAAYDKPMDFTKKKNIEEIIHYITS
ncbi:flavodoxin domain-containing protein [Clostridium formicaceticum]|uniref:Flavodoxin n=1 Tax=Clostridium formicaceticum TaxID=1497 RepID=A0AAC9RT36_9CLOT|nr:flavodoxin domain-containing protein [Clostridium formicaceticum]AOY75058.1 flavodoxin [Clostridium formicaceticum]ARE89480.1 flavodoxin [Clostridium formicaceticum]